MLLLLTMACVHHAPTVGPDGYDPRVAEWVKGTLQPQPAPAPCNAITEALSQMGSLLYVYDQAAWHATDAVEPVLRSVADADPKALAPGWLVVQRAGGVRVEWVTVRSGAPEVLVDEPVSLPDFKAAPLVPPGADAATVKSVADALKGRALTPGELAQYTALQAAIRHGVPVKAEHINVVTVPVGADEFWIYFFPATTDPSVELFGGAVQLVVKGGVVTEEVHHGEQVHSQPKPPPEAVESAAYLDIPSMVCPSETLVFSSAQYDRRIFLRGANGAWGIAGPTLDYLGTVVRPAE